MRIFTAQHLVEVNVPTSLGQFQVKDNMRTSTDHLPKEVDRVGSNPQVKLEAKEVSHLFL